MWVTYNAHQIRITNVCEAFNSKHYGMFYHSHPHIFILIEALLEVQEMSYLKMRSPGDMKTHPKETIISEYTSPLDRGKID